MNLPALCIRRPVMTTLLTAALCMFGAMAYRFLPVNDLPNVDYPTISVGAGLPGATPETMASAVATPLEQQFATIAGVDSMVSTSTLGSTQITLSFTLERNIDAAAQDVQAAIASVQRRLPTDMPAPPSLRKNNPTDQPVIYLTLGSPRFLVNRQFQFTITGGAPGQSYAVLASTNLLNWMTLTNGSITDSPFSFSDPAATNYPRRYYRLTAP